jgi:hypothetical protein
VNARSSSSVGSVDEIVAWRTAAAKRSATSVAPAGWTPAASASSAHATIVVGAVEGS